MIADSQDLMHTFPVSGMNNYDGLIKLKLLHGKGFSLFLPDVLVIDIDGWKWFQPKFFSACQLSFLDDAGYAQLNVDADTQVRLFIAFTKDRFVRNYPDKSQLYRCRVSSPVALGCFSTGTCTVDDDSNIRLQLFHHTLPETVDKILSSGHFLASPWNIQGNKKLVNVGYAYFTLLPGIEDEDDLRSIAMASDAKIYLRPTNSTSNRDVVSIDVYRQSTWDRRASIQVAVPVEIISSQHVWRHAPHGDAVYYEVSHSRIARIGLQPGKVLPFSDQQITPVGDEIKYFDCVVLGDADEPDGLTAPYDEQNTRALFQIENCDSESFFDFWARNSNTDQVSGRNPDLQLFELSQSGK